jgi:hypothetical protein
MRTLGLTPHVLPVLTLLGAGAFVSVSSLPAPAPAPAAASPAKAIIGLWYVTTWLGDPSDPDTITVQGALALHSDGTALLTATDHTGTHEFFQGLATPAQGVWEPIPNGIRFRLFEFSNGANPPTSFGILRITGECHHDGPGYMSGLAGVDELDCPDGAQGCPSPNASPFPPANQVPFEAVRFE